MLGADLVEYLSPYFSVASINKKNYHRFVNKSFNVLINANGNSKRFWANENILEDFNISTVSTYKSVFEFQFDKYIYISSSDVYEDHRSEKHTKEDQDIESTKLTPYGFHKYLSELVVKNYTKNFIILRCSMILGKKLKKGPIYDILNGNPLYISETSRLQMISTKEIANAIKFLIDGKITEEIFNVGGRGAVHFDRIQEYFPFPVKFSKKTEQQIYEMSINKFSSLFRLRTSEEYLLSFLKSIAD